MEEYTYQGRTGIREYFVHTPPDIKPDPPVPLVVMLHGCLQDPDGFADLTQMNGLADKKIFIVVYPQQTSDDNPLEKLELVRTLQSIQGQWRSRNSCRHHTGSSTKG